MTDSGAMWDTSCKNWVDRLKGGHSLCPDLPLHEETANKALEIFKNLRLPDVAGNPRLADACGAWFFDLVRAVFGSYDPETKQRAINEFFVLCPKKSSKTTYSAALLLTAVIMSPRPRAEFLFVGPTQEVANLAYKQAAGMIACDSVLRQLFRVQDHVKTITYIANGAFVKIKSFSPNVLTGTKPAGVLVDELHVLGPMHDADRVMGQLRGGLISQPEAFLLNITTQSERPPAGEFKKELDLARKVRDGFSTQRLLPILYEFPKEIDWRDQSKWWMVTPNRGHSVEVSRLVEEYNREMEKGEESLRRWASQHLNVEIGMALRSDRWAGADFWEIQALPEKVTVQTLIDECDVISVGIDGGGLDDLLGLAAVGRKSNGDWLMWTKAWAHPSVMERRKSEAQRFMDFERDGDLVLVKRIGDDVAELASHVSEVFISGKLDQVGVDPAGLGGVLDALIAAGVPEEKVIGISQGWKLTGAIKTAERKLAEGALWHGGQAMMAWCVGNAKVEPRGNAVVITKQAAGFAKIDPLMAAFNAITLMALNPVVQSMIPDGV